MTKNRIESLVEATGSKSVGELFEDALTIIELLVNKDCFVRFNKEEKIFEILEKEEDKND